MNKKKKITQIKHRKNKERIKKLQQASLLKAKPKIIQPTRTVEIVPESEVKTVIKAPSKKTTSEKAVPKKTTAKKAAPKKTTAKKAAPKKTPAKKKASPKKTPAKKKAK